MIILRARNIKPGFFTNEQLVECSPFARLLFIGLWCLADREGRLEDRPVRIKMQIFPADNVNVDELLNELQSREFIRRYEVNGVKVVDIPTFKKHQHINIKEQESSLPAPDNSEKSTEISMQAQKSTEISMSKTTSAQKSIEKHKKENEFCSESLNTEYLNTEKERNIKERKPPNAFSIPKPPDVTDQTWNDFVQLRKVKKAPVTETCIQGFRREAEKADITLEAALSVTVLHGWQGFKADWLRNKKRQSNGGYAKPPPKTNQRYDDVCENLPDDFYPPPCAYDLRDFDLNGKLIKKEGK